MKVSVVIRTYNSADTIGEVLWSLRSQRFRDYELVIVDSGSTDHTRELLKAHQHKFVDLSRETFTYSGALNAGCSSSSGEYIVCLSSHCVPCHEEWLGRLVQTLEDTRIAGAWGPPILDNKSRGIEEGRTEKLALEDFLLKPTHGLQNSGSIIRRELWQVHPFSEQVERCEDQEWAHYFLQKGYRTAVVQDAPVFYRYPHGTFSFAMKTFKNSLTLYQMFGYEGWRISLSELHRETLWFLRAIARKNRSLYSVKLPIASRVGRWLAGKAIDLKRKET